MGEVCPVSAERPGSWTPGRPHFLGEAPLNTASPERGLRTSCRRTTWPALRVGARYRQSLRRAAQDPRYERLMRTRCV